MADPTIRLQQRLEKFIKHVDNLENEDDPAGNGFHKEYRVLRDLAAKNKEEETFPATHGKLPCNIKKNRYRDIVPYDNTRVPLKDIPGTEGSDYVNASFILGPNSKSSYIASQGPLPHTLNDFWRMLWEYKVKVVIMACKEVEMGKKKCACYWPESVNEEITFDNIRVKLVSESNLINADDCIERYMEVYRGDEGPLYVTQFHYTGWPDHGIPDDVDVILAMIAKMRAIYHRDKKDFAPSVIHCSAGCGRTGTVCAIDYAWELLKTGKLDDEFSLYDIIKDMREQRQSMIQTPDQYQMAHVAVQYLFTKHLDVIQENVYANVADTESQANHNADLGHEDSKPSSSSAYEDIEIDNTYSYAEPTKLLEMEVISAVEIYTNPKARPQESPKTKRSSVTSSPKIPEKRGSLKERTSKKVLDSKVEQEVNRGTSSGIVSHQPENYTNVFKGERYTNVGEPLQSHFAEPQSKQSTAPPKPPLNRKLSLPNKTTQPPTENVKDGHGGPRFVSSQESKGSASVGLNFASQGEPKNTPVQSSAVNKNVSNSPSAGPKFVSSISVGIGGAATNMSSSAKANNTHIDSQKLNSKEPDMYALASNPTAQQSQNKEHFGPKFVQATSTSSSKSEHLQQQPPSGAVYAEVNKSSNSNPSKTRHAYDEVGPPSGPFIQSGGQVKGRGDYLYETVGTNGEYRPPPPSSQSGGEYEDVPRTLSDSFYSVAEPIDSPVNSGAPAPPIPNRGYRNDEVENRDQTKNISENTGTLGRLKDKLFKSGGSTADTNVDTSNIPGYDKRLDKKPKGKREKPSLWDKILR